MANTETKYPYKRITQFDNATRDAIRRYRFKHRMMSDAEVIRSLVVAGLEEDGVLKERPKRSAQQ